MQDIIHLLPDSVANQIAAGEVVQRPSSVVKELMENAIDAGATKVEVVISDGGRTLIQVIDNGCGMSETDARLSFERHATSKIRKAEDLFALSTMGFRGEALASIAAVAQVELITRRAEDELGTSIVLSGSTLEEQQPVMAPVGSNFKVKNLFFNIPARRKFLKSQQTEFNNIVAEFERIALINNSIDFSLRHNESDVVSLQASSFRKRILDLFGKKLNSLLVEVEVMNPLINIKGFVGTPESARKRGAQQYFFVNGRYMRHAYFAKAVTEAYSQMLPQCEQIPFFLCLDVEPDHIDVNIHPTKTEIKFEDEQILWKIIAAAVREALGRYNAAPGLDFDAEDILDIPAMDLSGNTPLTVTPPKISYNPNYNPYRSISSEYRKQQQVSGWESLYDGIDKNNMDSEEMVSPLLGEYPVSAFGAAGVALDVKGNEELQSDDKLFDVEDNATFMQFKGQYIITPVKSGLMLIHQRRAHIRVLYEKYLKQLSEKRGYVQQLLFPERIDLSVGDAAVLESIMDELSFLGFDISSLGGGCYAVNGVPADLDGLSPVVLLQEIISSEIEETATVQEKRHEKIALSMARRVAIVVGQYLSGEEMNRLIGKLFACEMPARTPDGKPIIHIMSDSDIEKFF